MGAITPVGNNVAETWENLIKGVLGVELISSFDTSALNTKIAAQIKNYDPAEHFDHKEARKMDIYTHYALVAAREAIRDAQLEPGSYNGRRIGVITGVGIGGIITFNEECVKNHVQGRAGSALSLSPR